MENLRKMRSLHVAPVDTMGCQMCSDVTANEETQRFHKLISLMLSSQTKDKVTFDAMQRLVQHGLTPVNIANTEDSVLENLLNPVSFYKV